MFDFSAWYFVFICRGSVVTLDCVEKLLKKDMLDPINNKLMKDSDIIQLKVWLLQIKLELIFWFT